MNQEEFKEIEKEIKLEYKRGSLLSILCILTFVGASIEIISSIYSFITIESHLETLQSHYEFFTNSGNDPSSIVLKESLAKEITVLSSWGKIGFIGRICASAICLIGAFLMWNLKKKGFKFYLVGQVLSLIVTFLILRGVGGLFASYYLAWIVVPLVLTGLYALQIKKMK